jgi:hypothetical protein
VRHMRQDDGKRTNEVRSRVQGEDDTVAEVCVVTTVVAKLQTSIARVKASISDAGSSVTLISGTAGSMSTRNCEAMKRPGMAPESMKEG